MPLVTTALTPRSFYLSSPTSAFILIDVYVYLHTVFTRVWGHFPWQHTEALTDAWVRTRIRTGN